MRAQGSIWEPGASFDSPGLHMRTWASFDSSERHLRARGIMWKTWASFESPGFHLQAQGLASKSMEWFENLFNDLSPGETNRIENYPTSDRNCDGTHDWIYDRNMNFILDWTCWMESTSRQHQQEQEIHKPCPCLGMGSTLIYIYIYIYIHMDMHHPNMCTPPPPTRM